MLDSKKNLEFSNIFDSCPWQENLQKISKTNLIKSFILEHRFLASLQTLQTKPSFFQNLNRISKQQTKIEKNDHQYDIDGRPAVHSEVALSFVGLLKTVPHPSVHLIAGGADLGRIVLNENWVNRESLLSQAR